MLRSSHLWFSCRSCNILLSLVEVAVESAEGVAASAAPEGERPPPRLLSWPARFAPSSVGGRGTFQDLTDTSIKMRVRLSVWGRPW